MLASILLGVALVFVPGAVVLFALGFGPRTSLAAAPAISAAYFGIMGVVYSMLGIFSNLLSLSIPLAILFAFALLVQRPWSSDAAHAASGGRLEVSREAFPWWIIALYVGLGLLTGYYVFVRPIPFSDGMVQSFDVVYHLNRVRSFANSGDLSSFANPLYSQTDVSPVAPSSGFYPSAFHAMAAVLCMATGIQPAGAINVMSLVFSAVVLPISLGLFLAVALGDRRAVACGSVVSTAFVMFPWTMLRWGPLFPNMAGLSCMLAVVVLVAMAVRRGIPAYRRIACGVAVLGGVAGLAFLQPNAVFAMGVIAALYLFDKLLRARQGITVGKASLNGPVCAVVFALLCCAAWTVVVRSPLLSNVVNFSWKAFTHPAQAVVNVLSLAFVHGFDMAYPEFPQYILGALIVVGFVVAASRKRWRWLCLGYLVAAGAFVLCATSDGPLKHLVAGPWYNDPYRVAAVVCINAMPLAALGVYWLVGLVSSAIERSRDLQKERSSVPAWGISSLVVFALVLVAIFFPNYSDPQTNQDVLTPFGFQRQDFGAVYGHDGGSYTKREADFVRAAEAITGDQSVIINVPADGSVASYGFDGLHAYYREMSSYGESAGETPESVTIRYHLNEVASNPEVQEAVRRVGAHYVLKLSFDDASSSISLGYKPEDWVGISSINDDTPGFEPVLSEGDLRLYRITAD